MRNGLPMVWRDSLRDLKHSVTDLIKRWRPESTELMTHRDSWPGLLDFNADWPRIDVEDSDDEIRIRAELPGMNEKDFQVELDSNRLLLHGEKRFEDEQRKGDYFYRESRFGSFYRAIPLPCTVEIDKAQAKYRHGVLRVRLPKTADARAQRKRIRVS